MPSFIITASISYDFAEEFWLGLNKTYSITKQGDYILRIELQDWKDNKRFIEYTFSLGGLETNYTLQLSRISGSIPNALPEQTELRFSTADQDLDTTNNFNCPENYLGTLGILTQGFLCYMKDGRMRRRVLTDISLVLDTEKRG